VYGKKKIGFSVYAYVSKSMCGKTAFYIKYIRTVMRLLKYGKSLVTKGSVSKSSVSMLTYFPSLY